MFEVKVTKKTRYEISDFRGVKDKVELEGRESLYRRLFELGAHSHDIFRLLNELDSNNTKTVFISPSEWSKVEEANRH